MNRMAQLHCYEDLERLVCQMGFLPFFRNEIPGFSVEEFTPAELWFADDADGPWEWKGPVVRNWNCVYGKLFRGKAGYVSLEWFPELVNYRRGGYIPTDDSSGSKEKFIYDTVVEYESLLSKEIKSLCGFRKHRHTNGNPLDMMFEQKREPKSEGFETALTKLQMGTYLVVADFEYSYDKHGEPYGWGIARYTTPEALYGEDVIMSCGTHSPEVSKKNLFCHFQKMLPQATETQISRIIG